MFRHGTDFSVGIWFHYPQLVKTSQFLQPSIKLNMISKPFPFYLEISLFHQNIHIYILYIKALFSILEYNNENSRVIEMCQKNNFQFKLQSNIDGQIKCTFLLISSIVLKCSHNTGTEIKKIILKVNLILKSVQMCATYQ